MSVQAGIWNLDEESVNCELLIRISQSIAEYGPDGEKTYLHGPVGMVYRPFHTTFESRLEHQPNVSGSGKVIMWDGRLDNGAELIPQLCNDLTDDRTDVAIVSAAFDRWGTDCFSKLTGDWAFSLWDPIEKELILARDYVGTRNLFYYSKPNRIIWCSHLVALALCGDQFTVCDEYVAGFFAFHPEAQLTPYREIHSVCPGEFVRIHNGKTDVAKFWAFNPRHRIRYKTDGEYEEHFRVVFRQAVRRRLRTDSPVLTELSGGLDSSSIVCMADQIVATDGAEARMVDTFSAFDREDPDEDDFLYFTKVEERRGRIGYHAELEEMGESFSIQYRNFPPIPFLGERQEMKAARAEAIKRGRYRVVLSGTGGDELLGQATDPRMYMADLLVQLRLRELSRQLMAWSLLIRCPWIGLLFQSVLWIAPKAIRTRFTTVAKVEPWIDNKFARRHSLSDLMLDAPKASWHMLPSIRECMHTITAMGRQLTNTVPSTYEVRYPYLDQTLAEFLISIPIDQLLKPGERRSLMRRALANLLPPEVLSRRTKAGSKRCYFVTLRKHWNEFDAILKSPLVSRLGYVNQPRFCRALLEMKNGQVPPTFVRLLRGLVLEYWIREALARGVISNPTLCITDFSRVVLDRRPIPNLMTSTTSASGVVDSRRGRR